MWVFSAPGPTTIAFELSSVASHDFFYKQLLLHEDYKDLFTLYEPITNDKVFSWLTNRHFKPTCQGRSEYFTTKRALKSYKIYGTLKTSRILVHFLLLKAYYSTSVAQTISTIFLLIAYYKFEQWVWDVRPYYDCSYPVLDSVYTQFLIENF